MYVCPDAAVAVIGGDLRGDRSIRFVVRRQNNMWPPLLISKAGNRTYMRTLILDLGRLCASHGY
jgi:hypothetical protein